MKKELTIPFNSVSAPLSIELSQLKPTQMTVGMAQVERKQKRIRALAKRPDELTNFILQRPIKVVLGPGSKDYVIDHHHLALALIREKYRSAPAQVEADYSSYTEKNFWKKMIKMHYVHPNDAHGNLHPVSSIPQKMSGLKDDSYRSLAAFAREEGGFEKVKTPFAEFDWADYFRSRISKKKLSVSFHAAVKQAVKLAKKPAAKNLPGYKPDSRKGL